MIQTQGKILSVTAEVIECQVHIYRNRSHSLNRFYSFCIMYMCCEKILVWLVNGHILRHKSYCTNSPSTCWNVHQWLILSRVQRLTKWVTCMHTTTTIVVSWTSSQDVRTKSMKTYQVGVTLNLDCFRPVSLYSDRVNVVWMAFLALTDKQTLLLWCTNLMAKISSCNLAKDGPYRISVHQYSYVSKK